MKVTIGILLVTVATLVWWLTVQITAKRQQGEQIKELTSQLGDKSSREKLEFQQVCALQAEKVFHSLRNKESGPNSYQSHYNLKLGRCFMELETYPDAVAKNVMTTKLLLDAYEQKSYAEYRWVSKEDKNYGEVPPLSCKLMPSPGVEQICKSKDEYEAFVASFME